MNDMPLNKNYDVILSGAQSAQSKDPQRELRLNLREAPSILPLLLSGATPGAPGSRS